MDLKKIKIAVLPGDGVGPEVVQQAVKVLDAVGQRFDRFFEYCYGDIGASSMAQFGEPLPEFTLNACREADAILFGAIGHPHFDRDASAAVRPEQGLLKLRKELELYADLSPVKSFPGFTHLSPMRPDHIHNVDLLIVRELTGGIYFGERGRSADCRHAYDTCTYNVDEITRIAHVGFTEAHKRRGKLTLVDKSNVLETGRLWREVVHDLHALHYSDIELEYLYADNAAVQLIMRPHDFDVLLTSNLIGDILSDESSLLVGSLGLLPSASLGEKIGLFEPVHGAYPEAARRDIANPIATILSAALLLDYLQLHLEANAVRKAVNRVLQKGLGTPDLNPIIELGCQEMGDMVAHLVEDTELVGIREEKIKERVSTII